MSAQLTCDEARALMLDDQRGRLTPEAARNLRAHLESCRACTSVDAEERVLSELLSTRLPRPAAPLALKERLAQQVSAAREVPPVPTVVHASFARPRRGLRGLQLTAASAALAACAVLAVMVTRPAPRVTSDLLVREAVNDHRRVLYATQPVEIANGGIHQVKPWFSGRVDFAPDVSFSGDDEFPMLGGAVGYFIDRKAATFIFTRRLHTLSLFIFRAEGLAWPDDSKVVHVGEHEVRIESSEGFHVLFWQAEGLGHALISDASSDELLKLVAKL